MNRQHLSAVIKAYLLTYLLVCMRAVIAIILASRLPHGASTNRPRTVSINYHDNSVDHVSPLLPHEHSDRYMVSLSPSGKPVGGREVSLTITKKVFPLIFARSMVNKRNRILPKV